MNQSTIRSPEVYVITYDHPHRKTQDLLFHLKLAGYSVTVLGLPWQSRRNHQPLFDIRLPSALSLPPDRLCPVLGFDYRFIGSIDSCSLTLERPVLIGGAPILSAEFVNKNVVINVHPGWLPKVRGLDALKWAIYYGYPIGVTVHRVDERVDMGTLLLREEVPLYPTDSLHSIATRQYELGLVLLVKALDPEVLNAATGYAESPDAPSRRMKHAEELVMTERLRHRLAGLHLSSGRYVDGYTPGCV